MIKKRTAVVIGGGLVLGLFGAWLTKAKIVDPLPSTRRPNVERIAPQEVGRLAVHFPSTSIRETKLGTVPHPDGPVPLGKLWTVFDREERDAYWAPAMEATVGKVLTEQLQSRGLTDVKILSLECKSTTCAVSVETNGSANPLSWLMAPYASIVKPSRNRQSVLLLFNQETMLPDLYERWLPAEFERRKQEAFAQKK